MSKLLIPARYVIKWFTDPRRVDRMLKELCIGSLALICVIGGAALVEFNTGIYRRYLKPSFDGFRAKGEQLTVNWRAEGWCKARNELSGVTEYKPEKAYNGLTLFTTMGRYPNADLIDMDGKVVHHWELSFHKAWKDSAEGERNIDDDRALWRRVMMFPNGDLIANYNVFGETPYGGGLVRLDKDSNVIWRYPQKVHHDFDVNSDGNVFTLIHENIKTPMAAAPHLKTPMIKDCIVVLSPEGKETKRFGVLEAFAKSEKYCHYLDTIVSNPKGDHTHTNDCQLITEAFAKHHDFCKTGDLLISLRESSMLAIVDVDREEVVWAVRGIWEFQHDPDPLDNGNLMVFDNQGNKGPGGMSRILEWNPKSGGVEWCYVGTPERPFETDARGCQELLPNGNVLITESNGARLFEVTHDGEIVWEYHNPHRMKDNKAFVGVVYSAQRFGRNELTFLDSPEKKSTERLASLTPDASNTKSR